MVQAGDQIGRLARLPGGAKLWLAVAVVVTFAGGGYLYVEQREELRRNAEAELTAVADLTVQQLVRWRRERLADAVLIQETPYATRRVLDALLQPESKATQEMLGAWLRRTMVGEPYHRALLMDASLTPRLVFPANLPLELAPALQAPLARAFRTQKIVATDLHRFGDDPSVRFGVLIPLVARVEGGRTNVPAAGQPSSTADATVAVLLLEVAAEDYLFPLMEAWPVPRDTAETLLVRRDGDGAQYLSDVRHRPDVALRLRTPLTQTNAIAAMAAGGRQGLVQGEDYRGHQVLAVIRAVPGSDWVLVSKQDVAEVLDVWRSRSLLIISILAGGVGLLGVAALALWQSSQTAHFQALHRAAAALRESEGRYRELFEHSEAVILIVDEARGTILDANPAACRFYGWERTRLQGRVTTELNVPGPDDLSGMGEVLPAAASGPLRLTQCRADGTLRHVEVYSSRFATGTRRVVFSIVHDVTARQQAEAEARRLLGDLEVSRRALLSMLEDQKRVEEALRGSERSYRLLFESNPNPMWVFDRGTLEFLEVNDLAVEHYGFSREEFLSMTILDIRPVEERARVLENLAKAKDDLRESSLFRHRKQDGKIILVEISSHAIDWGGRRARVVLATDVTERERARRELEASEERFRRAVNDAPFPIMLHAEDGTVVLVSRSWCEITGYSPDELGTVAQWMELAYGDGAPQVRSVIEGLYGMEHRAIEGDFVIRTRSGGERIWEFGTAPLGRLPDGRRLVISMATDVTERRQAEAAVRELGAVLEERVRERTAQLEASNRELEAFSYSVSHDLRAPLRAVNGYARILLEDHGPQLSEEGRRVIGVIVSEALRMGRLIDDLLRFSRLGRQALSRGLTDTTAMVQGVWDELLANAPCREAELRLGWLPEVWADAALFRQVWLNVVGNALKYSRRQARALIEVSGSIEGSEARFVVRDNGVGFDMKYAGKLFGVFQRLHHSEEFEGTGVGLALSQRLLQRHGGRIWVESAPDQGATFYFTVPVPEGSVQSGLAADSRGS